MILRAILLIFPLIFVSCLSSQEHSTSAFPANKEETKNYPTFSTHHFKTVHSDSLYLDVYRQNTLEADQPLVVFVHGGGFYAGTRKEKNIEHFCDTVSRSGYTVANISYHLYLKGQSFHCDQPSDNKVNAFASAVNDIRSAVLFLQEHADSLGFNPSKVYLAGSSAGAEAVLHAAFWEHDFRNTNDQTLPDNFKWSGVMAFAGAIVDTSLISSKNLAPTLLFHGSCDPLVPYGSATHHYCPEKTVGALMLHGSKSIYDRILNQNGSVHLVTRCGGKHGSAVTPIERDIPLILKFLADAEAGKPFQTLEVREQGKGCKYGDWSECE